MEATLTKELECDVELIRGRGGVFDVTLDGNLIYSKHQTGVFPDEFEVVSLIRAQSGEASS